MKSWAFTLGVYSRRAFFSSDLADSSILVKGHLCQSKKNGCLRERKHW